MISRNNNIAVDSFSDEIVEQAIFFDLEHYVYKKPICVGVFGCSYYDKNIGELIVNQHMIENSVDAKKILRLAEEYFKDMCFNKNKKYIITFSGNNDFTIINYLFNKYEIDFNIEEHFTHIDIQKMYEKDKKKSIGLKALEKEFSIARDSELISGSNLAKTFGKIMKDDSYFSRMPEDKKHRILFYNEQDVVSLFHIYLNWDKVIIKEELENGEVTKEC